MSDTLVDDLGGNLGKTMNVGFAGAEIAPFDSVVKEAKYRVAVVLVVLGGVDSSLSGDRVGAAGAVLIAEAIDLISQLGKSCGGGSSRETGADHDDLELSIVGRIDEFGAHLVG